MFFNTFFASLIFLMKTPKILEGIDLITSFIDFLFIRSVSMFVRLLYNSFNHCLSQNCFISSKTLQYLGFFSLKSARDLYFSCGIHSGTS
jgi:hypothetical protein